MPRMIAYCGLDCVSCPIHLATRQQDERERLRMRNEIARQCKALYRLDYTAADITDCDGCRSEEGRIFPGSVRCPVRICARIRKVESCASCKEYPCAPLKTFFAREPAAAGRLEVIRAEEGLSRDGSEV